MRTKPATVASFKPTLSTVSSMPGIDTGAPERTDTSSGRRSPPKEQARHALKFVQIAAQQIAKALGQRALGRIVVATESGGQHERGGHGHADRCHAREVIGLETHFLGRGAGRHSG